MGNHVRFGLERRGSMLGYTQTLLQAHSPQSRLAHVEQKLQNKKETLLQATGFRLSEKRVQSRHLQKSLHLVSPSNTLDRGYAIVQNQARSVVMDPSDTQKGESIKVTVSKGQFDAVVK